MPGPSKSRVNGGVNSESDTKSEARSKTSTRSHLTSPEPDPEPDLINGNSSSSHEPSKDIESMSPDGAQPVTDDDES